MMTGTIKTLRPEKGFGFIKDSSGKDFFFHQSAIFGEGIDNLREGDSVEFELGPGWSKGPRAGRGTSAARQRKGSAETLSRRFRPHLVLRGEMFNAHVLRMGTSDQRR